jgi:transcriptional regulator with XRE-family HTH domain
LYIGIVLKRIRVEKCISQEEVALRSTLNRTYISMLERNRSKPSLEIIFALAAALEIKPSEFIREIEEYHVKHQIGWIVQSRTLVRL